MYHYCTYFNKYVIRSPMREWPLGIEELQITSVLRTDQQIPSFLIILF